MNPILRAIATALFFACACVSWTPARAAEAPHHFVLEIDMAIERGGETGVLFDFGRGIWGDDASVAKVPPGNKTNTIRLPLPSRPIRGVRFDPTADDSPVLIAGMRVLTDGGELLGTLDPRRLRPMHQIQSISPEGAGVRVVPTAKADDPMLRLDLSPVQKRMHEAMRRPTVGRGVVVLLGCIVGALVVLAITTAWRALDGRGRWLGAAAIFCVVFGARLMWLNFYSRAVPFWDEWEGDVLYILIPFTGGFLDWGALVMPQWEHRILLTRTITLFGTVLNGEWDPRVAMTVSAGLYSATIALVGGALLSARRWSGVITALAIALCAALPYDFSNLLWGGQTQMYGLILLAICSITIATAPNVTPAVAVGALATGSISLFTMGAGPVGPGCAVGVCLLRAWFEPEQRRALFGLAATFFLPALAGVFLQASSRAHVPFYATNFAQFRRAFLGVMAWPLPPWALGAGLIWLPSIANGLAVLRRRAGTPLEWLGLGLATWGLVNAIALGYARQYEGPPFDSRFFTPISIGVLGSCCSTVALLGRSRDSRSRTLLYVGCWIVIAGLAILGLRGIAGARESRMARGEMEDRVRTFLATGDRAPVLEKPPNHSGGDVADRFESPLFRQVMPAAFRRVVLAGRASAGDVGLGMRAEAGPVTLMARTLMKLGPVIALGGLIGFGGMILRRRLTEEKDPIDAAPRPMAASEFSRREIIQDRACYLAAVAITLAWFLIYNHARPDCLVDEQGHIGNFFHFLEGKPGWPEHMPMLPGYHFLLVSLWDLHAVPWNIVTIARLATTLITLVGYAAFALTWRRLHGKPAGRATLLLALLPLTQPFTAMIYTDMPALAFALCAVWAQVTGRRAFAALVLIGATALRQTNLAWAALLLGWEWFRLDESHATWLRRAAWLLALLAAAAATILWAGRLTVGDQHGNAFQPNIATLHFGAVLLLLLGLPVWAAHAAGLVRRWNELRRARPQQAWGGLLGAGALAGLFALRFSNPHVWNRDLFWEGCTFTLLRNWPLVWIDAHPWLRVASGINLVAMTLALVWVFARQGQRRELWLAFTIGLLPVLTNSLVEPRYFIPAAGGVLLFLDFDIAEWRRLAIWWAVLCAAHAPFVARGLSLW